MNKYRTSVREKSLDVRGPNVWKSLSADIQNSYNIVTFKRSLTKYLVDFY